MPSSVRLTSETIVAFQAFLLLFFNLYQERET